MHAAHITTKKYFSDMFWHMELIMANVNLSIDNKTLAASFTRFFIYIGAACYHVTKAVPSIEHAAPM